MSLGVGTIARADTVVQVPIDELLNARPVSTLSGGQVTPWSSGQGIDSADGLVTSAVEAFLGQTGAALPDDGQFAANADHPNVALHFANTAPSTSSQTRNVLGIGDFQFAVPQATYSKLFLVLTSSYGAAPLTVTMTYADGTTSMTSFTLPDWGTGQPLPTTPPIFFNIASGMHKWDAQDQQEDAPVHTLTGVMLTPAPNEELTAVHVVKPTAAQTLVFWGAAAIATSSVDAAIVDSGGSSDSDSEDGSGDAAGTPSDARVSSSGETGAAVASGGRGADAGSEAQASEAGTGASTNNPASDTSTGVSASSSDCAAGASATAAPETGGSNGGCSVSAAPAGRFAIWETLLAFWGVTRLRRSGWRARRGLYATRTL
jgi:hypothetical protein